MLAIPVACGLATVIIKRWVGGKFENETKTFKISVVVGFPLWMLCLALWLISWRYTPEMPWVTFSLGLMLATSPLWSIACLFYFRHKKRKGTLKFRDDEISSSS